jgi:hypothetical protein
MTDHADIGALHTMLKSEYDALVAERDEYRAANESVAVCAAHTTEVTRGDCLVCAVEDANGRAEAAEAEVARLNHDAAAWEEAHRVAEAERDEALREVDFKKKALRNCREAHLAAEAENARLREALAEMHHLIQTRRTSIHIDGTEMFAQPLLAQLNSIARAALAPSATGGSDE